MSYLFFIFIFSAFNIELYQLERAENVWGLRCHYTDATTQVSYTLEVDPCPFVFLPGNYFEMYRVTIKERYKVRLHCDPIKTPGEFLSLLGANQIWSI